MKWDSEADRVSPVHFAPLSNPNYSFYFSNSTYFSSLFFVFKIQNHSKRDWGVNFDRVPWLSGSETKRVQFDFFFFHPPLGWSDSAWVHRHPSFSFRGG